MSKEKWRQGERIASIIHLLIEEGSKSWPELKEKYPKTNIGTLRRDIKLLKESNLVVEKKEARQNSNNENSRKIFMFYKDDIDIKGKTARALENLKKDYYQVTLDHIASCAGLPPSKVEEAAYALAPKLDMLIGKEEKERPPSPIIAGEDRE